jgi:hypothetical protein
MLPEPSRHPFRPPIPEASLFYFCSPAAGSEFGAPVHHGELVYAANGYVALRVRRFYGFPADYAPASENYLARWNKLNWQFLEPVDPKFAWRPMDPARGTLYRRGEVLPLWLERRGQPPAFNLETLVRTAEGPLIPLALLQLLARLPRAEVCMHTGKTLYVRFNGGEAIVPDIFAKQASRPAPKFSLFCDKEDPAGLEPFKF